MVISDFHNHIFFFVQNSVIFRNIFVFFMTKRVHCNFLYFNMRKISIHITGVWIHACKKLVIVTWKVWNEFGPHAFHVGQHFSIVRKVLFDHRNFLKDLNPSIQARQSARIYHFHAHCFFHAWKPISQPSICNVYHSYALPAKKLLVSEGFLFQDLQNFQESRASFLLPFLVLLHCFGKMRE